AAQSQPPAARSQPPAARSQPPAAQSQPPPAQSQPPPAQSQPPPALSQPPAAQSQPPTAQSQPPTAQSQPPAAQSQPPAKATDAEAEPDDDDDLDLGITDDIVVSRPSQSPTAGGDPLVAAFEALQDLFFLTSPFEGLDFVMRLLEDLLPAEAYSACLYDINSDLLRFVALTGPGANERKGDGVPRLAGLMGAAARAQGEAILVENATQDARYDPGVDGRVGLDVNTFAAVAVTHEGRLLGVLSVLNRRGSIRFSQTDGNLLAYVAEKLGEFLHMARRRAGQSR
ncbi:MAG: GAF domain-containing protein, partial [Sandaracinaceae bacterium]